MKRLLIIFLLVPSLSWAQDYGGASYYQDHPDSVDWAMIEEAVPDTNYGASWSGGNVPTGILIEGTLDKRIITKPVKDPRTAGYTDDSLFLVFKIDTANMSAFDPDDSGWIRVRPLVRAFGEGTKDFATSATGECDWVDAIEGTSAWGTAGAKNTTSDIYANATDSIYIDSVKRYEGDVVCTLRVATGNDVDTVFTYGVLLDIIELGAGEAIPDIQIFSDDETTAGNRPYWYGYETASAAAALSVGPSSIGAATVGAK